MLDQPLGQALVSPGVHHIDAGAKHRDASSSRIECRFMGDAIDPVR